MYRDDGEYVHRPGDLVLYGSLATFWASWVTWPPVNIMMGFIVDREHSSLEGRSLYVVRWPNGEEPPRGIRWHEPERYTYDQLVPLVLPALDSWITSVVEREYHRPDVMSRLRDKLAQECTY